jgi:hypothetical protein
MRYKLIMMNRVFFYRYQTICQGRIAGFFSFYRTALGPIKLINCLSSFHFQEVGEGGSIFFLFFIFKSTCERE